MLLPKWLRGLLSRKPLHTSPPTIHRVRAGQVPNSLEIEHAYQKRKERYNYYLHALNELHLDDGQHDAPTIANDIHRTDKIPELHEEE